MPRRALVILALVALATVPAASVAAGADAAAKQRTKLAKQARLKAFGSCKGLVRYGRRHAKAGPGGAPVPPAGIPEPLLGDQPPAPLAAPDPQTRRGVAEGALGDSGTNVQEAGVDEPDLVTAGGGRIFVVAGENLHAVDADGLKLLGSLPLGSGHQLLLHGDRLLVISHSQQLGSDPGPVLDAPTLRIAPGYDDSVTQLTELDVSSPAAMRVVRTERIRGHHVSSRLTGPTAWIVVWTRPRAVDEPRFRTQLRGWLPRRVLRRPVGGRPQFRLAARCRRVFRPALHSGLDVLTVLTIDMAKGLPAVDSDAVMASGQTVYASTRALYVATPEWVDEGDADAVAAGERTLLHKFDASDPQATLPRQRPGRGAASQPVRPVRARRRAARGHHRARRPGERQPRDHLQGARRGAGAPRPGGGTREGRAHLRRALPRRRRLRRDLPRSRSALHARSLRAGEPEGGGRAQDPGLLRLPAPCHGRTRAGRRAGRHGARRRARRAGLSLRRVQSGQPAPAAPAGARVRVVERGRVGPPRVSLVGAAQAGRAATRVLA
jgi:Beta propeller domain